MEATPNDIAAIFGLALADSDELRDHALWALLAALALWALDRVRR